MTSRGGVFSLQMLYLAGLGTLAGLYFEHVLIHRHVLGTLPIAVPWWGAVGAATLSLTGIFGHPDENWKKSYAYWYWARPFIGLILASFAVLAFQAGVLAVGTSTTTSSTSVGNPKYLFYYVVAFIVGYREETARELIRRVADVIIGPGDATTTGTGTATTASTSTSSAPSIAKLDPSSGPAGTLVTVIGTGLGSASGVTVAGAEISDFKAVSDTTLTFVVPGNGGGTVPVILVLKDGTALSSQFTYS